MSKAKKKHGNIVFTTAVASRSGRPQVGAKRVLDKTVLAREKAFAELHRQSTPIIPPGAGNAGRVSQVVCEGTARVNGLSSQTAKRYVTSARSIDSIMKGANPTGKAAEVVVISDYRDLHSGSRTGIVNPPNHVAKNVADIRLAPDPASRKDLLFAFETSNGDLIWKYNGQVKTGGAQYIVDSLVDMARTPGYGKVGYVDARLINPDGTPKVGPDAFTKVQALRLQEAKVRLRGIPDLEKRAAWLVEDIRAAESDGFSPATRQRLEQFRNDIAKAYGIRGTTGRIVGNAAIAAATAAVASLVVQLTTEGQVNIRSIGHTAASGAASGVGGAAADASLYHLATKTFGMPPEAAKEFAQQGVAAGFCVIAIGADLLAESSAVRHGEITLANAVGGMAVKTALDLLPLVMASLGFAGVPLLIASQLGGRWVIEKAREADRLLNLEVAEDMAFADHLEQRMNAFSQLVEKLKSDRDAAGLAF